MKEGDPRPAATEIAYHSIRARIMSGDLKDGERLKEQSTAGEKGRSRTPTREAIKRLIIEGFVERGDGYSTRVADSAQEEIDQIFEIRKRLECYAVERAALLATDAEIDNLDNLAQEMKRLTPPKNAEGYARLSELNDAFHRQILGAARSPRLTAVLSMAVNVGIVARTYRTFRDQDLVRSSHHHLEMVQALRAKSPDGASSVMSSHIMAAADAIRIGER